jgi:hypothetical protein
MNVNLEILYEINVNFERVIHFVHFGALGMRTRDGGRNTARPTLFAFSRRARLLICRRPGEIDKRVLKES